MVTSKQLLIEQFINAHPFQQVSTTALAATLNISLPTVLSYIKNHPHRFTKVKHGWYQIQPNDHDVVDTTTTVTTVSTVAVDHHHPSVQMVETQLIASWDDPQLGNVAITVVPHGNNHSVITEYSSDDLVYYPNAAIPFPKNTSVLHNNVDLEQSDLLDDTYDVEHSNQDAPPASRPFDW